MPALLVPVFVAAFSAAGVTGGITIAGTAISFAAIAANLTIAALSIAGSAALQSSTARKQKKAARRNSLNGSGQSVQQTIRLSVSPRQRHYGRVRAAGALEFVETKSGTIHQCVVFNNGTITEFEEFFVGGKPVLLDADGAVTQSPYWIAAYADPNLRSLVRIESRRGYASQVASSILTGAYPGQWTDAHKLNGLAYAVLACKQVDANRYQTVYNSQIPALTAIFRGVPVFDPRKSYHSAFNADSWEFSDNPALCLLDYLAVGMNVARGAIDQASFIKAADHCDETVPLKGGGVEKRYRMAGAYSYDEEPRQVIERILDTFRGGLYLTPDGTIGVRVSTWEEPDFEIRDEVVVTERVERRQGILNEFNAVKVIYTSPAHNWQEQQAHTIRDETSVARLGREIVDETRLPMVFSHTQAQRLAKIELYEDNPEWLGEMVCHGPAVLALKDKKVFRRRIEDLGIEIVCRITGFTPAADISTVKIQWESIDKAAYDWNPEAEQGAEPALPPDTSTDPLNPGLPTGLTYITETSGAGVKAALRWTVPDRAGQVFDIRYRKLSSNPWTLITSHPTAYYITPEIPAGTAPWDWEVRVRTSQGGVSGWAASTFTDTAFSATSLAPPTNVTATGGQESVVLGAKQSPTAQAWAVQFAIMGDGVAVSWTGATSVVGAPLVSVSAQASATTGAKDVYARAVSPLGTIFSTAVGPIDVTVADLPPGGGGGGGSGGDGSSGGAGGSGNSSGGSETGGADNGGTNGDGTSGGATGGLI